MKSKLVQKHLPKSPATSKGHMKRPRAGIRSTRPKRSKYKATESPIHPNAQRTTPETVPIIVPHESHELSNVFCFAALADKQKGTFYTDATGALPAVSLDGNQYYFIAYDYDTNYIFAIPIKDVKDATLVAACEEVFNTLKEKGYKPTLNITDNQAVRPLKEYLKSEECAWQFVEPANHRVNTAERAIQTFKNHFISGLCSTNSEWPLQLWDTLTIQAVITMNLLRTSRMDPSKSAYH